MTTLRKSILEINRFTDTDSFLYRLKTSNVHADMIKNHDLYDFSNFPNDHSCFRGMSLSEVEELKTKNKKKLGKIKDELAGESMLEFVGLRSKMYCFRSGNSAVKKLKGIPSLIVKIELTFDHYKQCLQEQSEIVTQIKLFRSHSHHVTTKLQSKFPYPVLTTRDTLR